MPEIGSASLAITPSFRNFQSNLENGTSKHMAAAGVTGGTAFGDSAGKAASGKFRAHIKSAAKVAAVGLGLAAAGAIKFAGDSIAEAREAQKVGALTRSTIKATGGAAKVTAKQVGDLAGKISAKTGIDDEAIQAGQNMLLTFKNIRNEAGEGNKIFDESSRVLVDLSSAMGTDAKSSAIQLGKALNDPVKGITALTRVGVTFTDQQKKQIEQMAKAGDLAGAQKVILRELKSEFGGAAAAQATEADKLSVAWGNFKEEIGTELLPVMDDLARFLRKKGIPAAKDFAGWVRDDMIPAAKDAADEIEPIVDGIKDVVKWVGKLPKPAKLAGLAAILGGVGYAKLRGGNSAGGGGALGTVGKALGLAKPVRTFETNPAALGGGVGGAAGATGKVATILSKGVLPVAIVAASAKGLKDFFDWNHKGDKNPVEHALTGGKMGDKSRQLHDWIFGADDAKRYEKNLGVVNNAWSKVGDTVDGVRESTKLYDGTVRKVPTLWSTVFETPGLLREKLLVEKYGSLLDGLDDRTITTFFKSVSLNKPGDVGGGEAGTTPGQPPNRSGGDFERSGVTVNIGEVRPNNYSDFMHEMDRRTRGSSLDGVR